MQVVIHGINRKEKFSKKGEKFESLGIKYRGKWYSGFGSKVTDGWDIGMTVNIDLWEEPGSDGKMYGKFVVLIPNKAKERVQEGTEQEDEEHLPLDPQPGTDPTSPNTESNSNSEEVAIEDLPF